MVKRLSQAADNG